MTIRLGTAVDWYGALSACNAAPAHAVLPGRNSLCPLCRRSRACVYNDSDRWGIRAYCQNCKQGMDLVGFIAASQKLERDQVGEWLCARGLISADHLYLLAAHERRLQEPRELQRLWTLRTDDASLLQAHQDVLGVPLPLTHGWMRREGLWLAGFERGALRQVGQHYGPCSRFIRQAAYSRYASMIAAPLEDAPGNIVDYCIGHTGSRWITLQPFAKSFTASRVLGAGPGLFDHNADFVIAVPDMVQVLRTQFLAYRSIHRAAPMVGVSLGTTPSAMWRASGKRIVFLAAQLSPALLREAMACDGHVLISHLQATRTRESATLPKLAAQAVPWRQQLSSHLHQLSAADGLIFLEQLNVGAARVQELLSECAPSVQRKLRPSLEAAVVEVQYGRGTVSRQGSRLFLNDEMIADTIPLLERVHPGPDPIYEGHLLYHRHSVKFRVRASALEQDPERWIRHKLWRHGCGAPFIAHNWRAHIVQLGQAFGNPQFVEKRPPLGLHHKHGTLELPDFAVLSGGILEPRPTRRPALPCGTVAQTGAISPAAVEALSRIPETNGLLACLAHMTATLMSGHNAPVPPHLLLLGADAQALGLHVAQAFGLVGGAVAADSLSPRFRKKLMLSQRHRCPVVLRQQPGGMSELRALFADAKSPRFILCPANTEQGVSAAVAQRCAVARVAGGGSAHALAFAADLACAYFMWLGRKQFRVERSHGDILADHYASVLAWWDELGGTVRAQFWTGQDIWGPLLAELLGRLLRHTHVVPAGFRDTVGEIARYVVESEAAGTYLLPPELVATIGQQARFALDVTELRAGLLSAGQLTVLPDGAWRIAGTIWSDSAQLVAARKSRRTA